MWARRTAWVPLMAWLAAGAVAADRVDPEARARELFEDVCSYCHNLHKVDGHELSREEWTGLIKGMVSEGAPVTDEEFSLIVDYLAKHWGKRSPEEKR